MKDLTALVAACTAALSSVTIVNEFFIALYWLCKDSGVHRTRCGAAGVIEAVVAALHAYGPANAMLSMNGCRLLGELASGNTANADAIVLSTGGLDVVLSCMASIDKDSGAASHARALLQLAEACSPAAVDVLRASRAEELLNAAKRTHADHDGSVTHWANLALAALR